MLPWPRVFFRFGEREMRENAPLKTREERGKTSGGFVSDSWFG